MIALNPVSSPQLSRLALVRYGAIPEVARCGVPEELLLKRDQPVVVETNRGEELGRVLEVLPIREAEVSFSVLRMATDEDLQQAEQQRRETQGLFVVWQARIREWKLDLELLDVEWTLNRSKLVLYVLSGRGADTTKLALQAATASSVTIEVQPVSADGLVPLPTSGGGCGSGGCGCHT